jgi:hypothetical protein
MQVKVELIILVSLNLCYGAGAASIAVNPHHDTAPVLMAPEIKKKTFC